MTRGSVALWTVAVLALGGFGCQRVETILGAQLAADANAGTGSVEPATGGSAGAGGARRAVPAQPIYFEAESGTLAGFSLESSADASGGEFILPPPDEGNENEPGTASARYSLGIEQTADYVLWGRIHGPGYHNDSFFVSMDGQPPVLWRLSTGDVWHWGFVTSGVTWDQPVVYSLEAGPHELSVQNAEPGMELDLFYLTSDGSIPPGNTTRCNPPHSIELGGECVLSCGSLSGTACGEVECAGLETLPAYDCEICCIVTPDPAP